MVKKRDGIGWRRGHNREAQEEKRKKVREEAILEG